jgi:cytochrome c oxidase subunit IV
VNHAEAQQHPIGIYLVIWGLLFVLSVCSYMVDYLGFHSYLKWFLITLFMLLKAGLIVSVFMHMAWERLAIVCAIMIPPGVILFLMGLMALEAHYTFVTRLRFFLN